MTRATWLADVLRYRGLKTVEHKGWKDRGRDFTDLRAVMWHHDASPPGDSPGVPAYMIREIDAGRAGAQLWVSRQGVWHIVAAGAVGHAGKVLPGMPGNGQSLGAETDHTVGEPWPSVQLASLRHGTAAILKRMGQDASGLHFHATACDPPGRKQDPAGLDLRVERGHVALLMARRNPPTDEDDMTKDEREALFEVRDLLRELMAPRRPDKTDANPHRLTLSDVFTQDERSHP